MERARFDPSAITRPDRSLMTYYFLCSLLAGPFFFFPLIPLWIRYETLRYRFDEDGVHMRWGILLRREINLTYRRIQDIHLTRNLIQRWMGLATVAVQTASGGSGPEMSLEGILDPDGLRDFLYQRMRGAKGEHEPSAPGAPPQADEALTLLREIRDNLAAAAARSGGRA